MFDHLMDEVQVINQANGWVGCFDAIKYIFEHREDYSGTKVYKEVGLFMRMGAEMFKEKE